MSSDAGDGWCSTGGRATSADCCFHNREGGIVREVAPSVMARVVPHVNVMLSVVVLEPGAVSPAHYHANEQWAVCLEDDRIRIQEGVVPDVFALPREQCRQAGRGLGAVRLA